MPSYQDYVDIVKDIDEVMEVSIGVVENDPNQVYDSNEYVFVASFRRSLERWLSATKKYEYSYQEYAKQAARQMSYFIGEDVPRDIVKDLANRLAQKVARFMQAVDDETAIEIMLNNIVVSIGEEESDEDEEDD